MDRYKETHETWNKVASLYQDKFMNLDIYNETYEFFCNSIFRNNANILEIGCGPGNITKYLLSKRPDFNIYGIDIAPNMITLAQENNPTANFAVMDCRQISGFSSKYEGIICGFCLPYLSLTDGEKLISDSYHLLNESGCLYLSFVNGEPNNSGYAVGSSGDRVFFYYYNLDNLIVILNKIKFEILKIYNIEYIKSEKEKEVHTILIAKKQMHE